MYSVYKLNKQADNTALMYSFHNLEPACCSTSDSNFYAEYIMRNAGLEEAQAGISIARRNNNNLRYTDDTTLMAES